MRAERVRAIGARVMNADEDDESEDELTRRRAQDRRHRRVGLEPWVVVTDADLAASERDVDRLGLLQSRSTVVAGLPSASDHARAPKGCARLRQ